MTNLTDTQKDELYQFMNRNEDAGWSYHAAWATRQFGVPITEKECARFFMERQFGG